VRAFGIAALLAAIVVLSAGPSAQGLADAARRSSATPPQQTAAKKYTNEDVQTAKPVPTPAVAVAQSEAPATEARKTETAKSASAAEEMRTTDPEPKKAPEYVINRIATLKAQLANSEKQLRDLQARGAANDAAFVTKQIANAQTELKVLEARVSGN
jgi:hypothetical protein